jgi:hypothetical protein
MMVQVGDVIVSSEVFRQCFACDLSACRGACCIDGDAGAPIAEDEIERLRAVVPLIEGDLSAAALAVIRRQGVVYRDRDGEWVTSLVDNRDCVFATTDASGCCRCAIEKAYLAGTTDFYKPISCHLYPIRVSRIGDYDALNFNHWSICRAAELRGVSLGIPAYRFLKEPLIRKYGSAWYEELEVAAGYFEGK